MTRIGQGSIVKHEKGSIIPSKKEIIKDLIKWFATEYGLDLAEALFEPIDPMKLQRMWLERKKKQQLAAKSGGGGAIVLLALLAFGGKRGRRR